MVVERSGQVLAVRVEQAVTYWTRLVGLLGRSTMPDGFALLIRSCASVHTWFMRFPIDVVFLDADDRVLRIVPELPPFRMASCPRRARAVLELGSGAASRADLQPGDRLLPGGEPDGPGGPVDAR